MCIRDSPLFYSHEQIAALEKRNYIHPPKQPILKRLIKKTPLAQKYIRIKGIIGKYKDDFYWYIPKIYDRQDNLERMIYQYENNQEHLSALSLNEKKLTEINENLKLFDKRFSELEKKIHLSKTKLDEAWWLSWNIKAVSYTHLDVYKRQLPLYHIYASTNANWNNYKLRSDEIIDLCQKLKLKEIYYLSPTSHLAALDELTLTSEGVSFSICMDEYTLDLINKNSLDVEKPKNFWTNICQLRISKNNDLR